MNNNLKTRKSKNKLKTIAIIKEQRPIVELTKLQLNPTNL